MSTLSFIKYHGAGNDFILIDDRALLFHYSVSHLCHRKFGIGADGLILLQTDPVADFRMRIFNSDGSEAESCGNGLRCLMKFILDLGLPKQRYRIATGDRIVSAEFMGEQISVEMGRARDVKQIGKNLYSLDTGVPHVVVFVSDIQSVDILKEGAGLRNHPLFQPRGTNVNFASLRPDGSIHVRTYERGLEGETLACGTGGTAVAVIASQWYQVPSPVRIVFPGGGMEIYVAGFEARMVGGATQVFAGTIELD